MDRTRHSVTGERGLSDSVEASRRKAHEHLDWMIDRAIAEKLWGKVGVTVVIEENSILRILPVLDCSQKVAS